MPSAVSICNNALAAIGTRSTISSLTENSAEARACARLYEGVVKQAMRAAHWGFCKKFANLSLLKALPGTPENTDSWDGIWSPDYPPPPWLYTYAYPQDCLQLRYVVQTFNDSSITPPLWTGVNVYNPYMNRPAKFSVGSDVTEIAGNEVQVKTINTNQQSAIACYTVYVEDPNLWDVAFEDVVESALAGKLAMPLVGSRTLEEQKIKIANAAIVEARVRDGNEGLTMIDSIPDWIRVRGGYPTTAGEWQQDYMLEYGPLFG